MASFSPSLPSAPVASAAVGPAPLPHFDAPAPRPCADSGRTAQQGREPAYLTHYRTHGFAVVRGVFRPEEVRKLSHACDRVHAKAKAHGKSFRHQNVFFRLKEDPALGPVVRFAQWPAYYEQVLDRFRKDPRLLEILRPLLGQDLKQIINQINWKRPGASQVEFGYHQDIHFRRPRAAYRNTHSCYIQTAIAVDPHTKANGAMKLYPGSHRMGALDISRGNRVMDRSASDEDLRRLGLDPSKLVDLVLDPGDVAFWNLYTIHGSGRNTTDGDRRVYLNGYARAEDCDRGEWTFRDGKPCDLGEPVLVHYEDLYTRPGPHYVDD
ncbi:MAG TPA: phytanoyl-CoA dioxygenase family protein [Kiloniellaceae bacterium]|nr:phytanoyl-CoA dioxygenase family protein [Kiloniellaceae bacterium]